MNGFLMECSTVQNAIVIYSVSNGDFQFPGIILLVDTLSVF